MTKFFEIQEVKNHELLITEKTRLTDTRAKLSQSVMASTQAAASKSAELNNTERDFIHGKATAQQIDLARQDADTATAKLTADERMLKLAGDALNELSTKITEAARNVVNEKYSFCVTEHNRIIAELNNDTRFQKLLAEAFAAQSFNGLRYFTDFAVYAKTLTFTAPDPVILQAAVDKFAETHRLTKA